MRLFIFASLLTIAVSCGTVRVTREGSDVQGLYSRIDTGAFENPATGLQLSFGEESATITMPTSQTLLAVATALPDNSSIEALRWNILSNDGGYQYDDLLHLTCVD
jgi:hypothetical protein